MRLVERPAVYERRQIRFMKVKGAQVVHCYAKAGPAGNIPIPLREKISDWRQNLLKPAAGGRFT